MARALKIIGRTVLTKGQLIRAIEHRTTTTIRSTKKPAAPRRRPSTTPPTPTTRAPFRVPPAQRGPDRAAYMPPSDRWQPSMPGQLPEQYGSTILILQARDPYWLHAYWEIFPADGERARRTLGASATQARVILRVYELTTPSFSHRAVRRWFDVALTVDARDWYVEVGQPSVWWCLEFGWLAPDGRFVGVVRSNVVETPADQPSDDIDEEWGLLGEAFAEQYHWSRPGGSSPGVSSPGAPRWGTAPVR